VSTVSLPVQLTHHRGEGGQSGSSEPTPHPGSCTSPGDVATQHDYPAIDAAATAPGAPASVTVAISEVIADVREGLLAMAVGAG
jgi:hypothetical protein